MIGRLFHIHVALLLLLARWAFAAEVPGDPATWPQEQQDFWFQGPGLLIDRDFEARLRAADAERRGVLIAEFLGRDPLPGTEANELTEGIDRRRRLARREHLTFLDDRAKLLFLHGAPLRVDPVDCDQTFRPLELWAYSEGGRPLILYRPQPEQPYRLWLPLDSKRALYSDEMVYWLEQFHELRSQIRGRRIDLQICRWAATVDQVTGIGGLHDFSAERPGNEELLAWLRAPADLAAWAQGAAATPLGDLAPELRVDQVEVQYPERRGQRIVSRLVLTVPTDQLETIAEGDRPPEYRVQVEGQVQLEGRLFEDFRMRYLVGAESEPERIALVVDRALRPHRDFRIYLRVRDEIGGGETLLGRTLSVPDNPRAVPELPVPERVVVALGDQMSAQRVAGRDAIVLVPPETDVVLGLWRADTLVSGERIQNVRFLVDGQVQFTRTRPPFSAEIRLATYPQEQVIRVEGYDAEGELVASDEVLVNQQRGELQVQITEPERGGNLSGEVTAAAEVVVPEERQVAKVEFYVNEELVAVREAPPWRTTVEVPPVRSQEDVAYLTVVAELDDGARAEDVRFLNVPSFMDEVEVDLVELYTTVTDRSNRLVRGLESDRFQVFEDGRPQRIVKFELVEDLPLTIGITIDTSGSMIEALGEARRAAVGFLEEIITPKDRSFAVSFADRPVLLMPRTSDVGAVAAALEDLRAVGSTSLHDAVVTSLYYFRGVRGRRALVLLSDGEDTASTIAYRDAAEYARRSGVAIFTIGLSIGRLDIEVRRKLNELAEVTGGRSFYIKRAVELEDVYEEIEQELRSQYLIAYNSDRPQGGGTEFREVEVKVQGSGLQARTISGYYP
ncbi:MAG TPA: VWA domain-containing protein [Thermoanaerobaculia bacterium]|nr:VWA domain-containing protein [Thermoanaerobaculia bacterium]